MNGQIFIRATPATIKITEKYAYRAIFAGNSTLDPEGQPEGHIQVEIPLDGHRWFPRQAYADAQRQITPNLSGVSARCGYLAFSGISKAEFWSHLSQEEQARRTVLPLDLILPDDLSGITQDAQKVVLQHSYHPKPPIVDPRPAPINLQVDIYDERTFSQKFTSVPDVQEWARLNQELSLHHSLIFEFRINLALPRKFTSHWPPRLNYFRLEWPVETSYHNLCLKLEPEDRNTDSKNHHDAFFHYLPFLGCVEWGDLPFRPGEHPGEEASTFTSDPEKPHILHLPRMLLEVRDPGELYRAAWLEFKVEIDLPGALLSGARVKLFDATGAGVKSPHLELKALLTIEGRINLRQRFDQKIHSPTQRIQFEGLVLEEIRMEDIAILLRDLGFRINETFQSKEDEKSRTGYLLIAERAEGPDFIKIWVLARGAFLQTERETVIPGGKTYTTRVRSGNVELDIHAELRGNIAVLARTMNEIHQKLKERFHHVSTLE